jgi:hypothetical protein
MLTGDPVTYLTFDNYFLFIYAWAAFWCILCSGIMVNRREKNASDWEIIGFRFLVGLVSLSVVFRFLYDQTRMPIPPNPYTIFLAVCLGGMGWFAMKTTIRVINIVRRSGWQHDTRREDVSYPNDETPEEGVERRHHETLNAFPHIGSRTIDVFRPKDDLH